MADYGKHYNQPNLFPTSADTFKFLTEPAMTLRLSKLNLVCLGVKEFMGKLAPERSSVLSGLCPSPRGAPGLGDAPSKNRIFPDITNHRCIMHRRLSHLCSLVSSCIISKHKRTLPVRMCYAHVCCFDRHRCLGPQVNIQLKYSC